MDNFTSSQGVKTAAILKNKGVKGGGGTIVTVQIQNIAAAVLYGKYCSETSETVSETDFDFVLKACTVEKDGTSLPVVIEVPDSQIVKVFSSDIKYTVSYR